jgi:hypothetical protein
MGLVHAYRPTRQSYLAAGLLLAVAAGGVRAVDLAATAGDDARTFDMAGASWQVVDVEQVVGVAQRDLMSGMGHNINGYVSDSQMMVRVAVVVSAGDHRTSFSAGWLKAYEDESRTPMLPSGGSLGAGFLAPHATVEGTVTFVVPRDGGHLVLKGRGSSHVIDLTTIAQAPPGVGDDDHDHHSH